MSCLLYYAPVGNFCVALREPMKVDENYSLQISFSLNGKSLCGFINLDKSAFVRHKDFPQFSNDFSTMEEAQEPFLAVVLFLETLEQRTRKIQEAMKES